MIFASPGVCQHMEHVSAVSRARRYARAQGSRIIIQAGSRHDHFGDTPRLGIAAEYVGESRLYAPNTRLPRPRCRRFTISIELEDAGRFAPRSGPYGFSRPLPWPAGGTGAGIQAHGAPRRDAGLRIDLCGPRGYRWFRAVLVIRGD